METGVNMKQFYKELGKLLYAVAFADNKVRRQEISKLQEIVTKNFASFEERSDGSGMNLAFYTRFEFDKCARNKMSAQDAFESFLSFVDSHVMEIDPLIIERSIKATKEVAASFRSVNKKERDIIQHIEEELTKFEDLF
jgi:hypothetical protein